MPETPEIETGTEVPALLQRVKQHYKLAREHSRDWRREATEDYDFVAGEQWSDSDKQFLRDQLRPVVVFNRVDPIIQAVSGSEVNNRQEIRYIPREVGDAQVSDVWTSAAKWVRDQCDAEDEESEMFKDLVTCGMGWTETRLSYDADPDGMILVERVDPLEMYWDPDAKKQNLSDAKWLMRVKDVTADDFRTMWPDSTAATDRHTSFDETPVGEPHRADLAFLYEYDQSGRHDQSSRKFVRVVEYQWWQYESYYRVLNPKTQKIEELSVGAFERIREKLEKLDVQYLRQRRRAFYRCFAAGTEILEFGPCPCPTDFTFKCVTGKRDRNRNLWHGLVRSMKDPQRWANKFFSQTLHIVNTQAKGGVLAERSAFANVREAEEKWAHPDSLILLEDGAISGKKVMERPMGQFPTGVDRLMQFAISSLRDVSGVNLELLGMADREQAGVLEAQRKQAGLTILAGFFNALRRYRKEQGRVLLHMIREYISDGRLIRVLGQDGAQYVPLARERGVVAYDIHVDDAPTSPNMKEQTWAVLQNMLPFLSKAGIPTPPEVLDYLPFPAVLVEKWKQLLEQSKQPSPEQQLAQQKMQAEVQKLQAEAAAKQASAQLDGASFPYDSEETKSRTFLNYAKAQAEGLMQDGTHVEEFKAQQEAQLKQQEFEQEGRLKQQELEQDWHIKQAELHMKQAELLMKLHMQKQEMGLKMQMQQQQMQMDQQLGQQKVALEGQLGQQKIQQQQVMGQQQLELKREGMQQDQTLAREQTYLDDDRQRQGMSLEDERARSDSASLDSRERAKIRSSERVQRDRTAASARAKPTTKPKR